MAEIKRYLNKNKKIVCYIKLEQKHDSLLEINNNMLKSRHTGFVHNEIKWTLKYINRAIEANQRSKFESVQRQRITYRSIDQLYRLDIKSKQWKKFPKKSISHD